MLDNQAVLAKTDTGRDAVARRTHQLNPRQRALLISINGESDVAGLVQRFGAGAGETAQSLLEQGLVALVNPTQVAAPAVAEPVVAVAPAVAPRRRIAAKPDVPATTAVSMPARTAIASSTASGALGTDWRNLQERAGHQLHEVMGSDADLLCMRLERARSEDEFLTHFERAIALVDDARGPGFADAFRRSVLTALR